jgi:hypothetical protein
VIQSRQTATVDFTLAHFTTFQGSLVICDDSRARPVPGTRLALVHGDSVIPLQASASGSFQSDNIAPAQYDLVFDPTSLPEVAPADIPKITIALRRRDLAAANADHESENEIAGAEIPDTLEAHRYVAKIAGAIVP